MKKLLSLLLAIAMVFASSAAIFADVEPIMTTVSLPVVEDTTAAPANTIATNTNDIVIIATHDAHCGNYANYAKVATLAKDADLLVDSGDAIQGGALGSISKGEYVVKIMNKVGYDVAAVGNHEFDYGIARLQELANMAEYTYLSCNFVNTTTKQSLFDGYKIIEVKGKKIALIGITTPVTFTQSNPANFQDANGNYIYSFCEGADGKTLYAKVQATVDAAKAAGADYVIGLGHLGIEEEVVPYRVDDVLANVTGFDALCDAHSHDVYTEEKSGVVVVQTGTKLANAAKIVIKEDGTITAENVALDDTIEDDAEVKAFIDEIDTVYKEKVETVVAKSEVDLVINDENGKRIVRTVETNLGDLCADAYRTLLGADIAFVNGGGVRATIPAGDITLEQIMNVHPFGNLACLVEVTGQQILDALELGASKYPNENGGFLQVSGITYTINTTIESSVVLNDKGAFTGVSGARRVSNVLVGGVPIDPAKTYKLASHNYMLKSAGDGFAMFGKDNVKLLKDEVMVDNEVLINYVVEYLGGVIGQEYAKAQGRIIINNEPVVEEPTVREYKVVKGDCLWAIAKRTYGNGSMWKLIYEANKSIIKNPNRIYVNQVLVLPEVK